ncbi:hypothetical protein P152DRAFT_458055 [Eremomyces bilateralis CBS 781.70]|uniref:Uncharacterized protein n=1 Tax=Eremomyces bilateralis CBS 781.70 TaxID=1392243 RepID=A0A6G1G447_9PEZI|nr:uncharacterized protein P152DRAFT_458055 [Eremomyces bilateralis CBS 781.70]KAF1812875.1 hypothetical protein P152DRAFT_458055 [Eremomyces bilateralis CBS 781.70]
MFGIGINLDEEKKKTDAWLLKGSQGKDPVDSKLEELRERFGLTVFKANRAKNALKRLCRPFGNKNPDEDFAPVLLCHAQLYVFGDKYDIKNLRWLALEKLRATLVSFQLHEQRVQDVVQLVRYAYGNTAACPMEPLRDMLAQYLAGRIKVIGSNEAFHVLLKEGGEFVTDFWGQILAQVLS